MLIKAIKFKNFMGHTNEYYLIENGLAGKDCVPIGSVEFVFDFLESYHGVQPKPQNIPDQLLLPEFTKRWVFVGTEADVTHDVFFKSHDCIKGYSINSPVLDPVGQCPAGNYFIQSAVKPLPSGRG